VEVQWKYVKYVDFIWPSLEAALSIFKMILSVKELFLKELIKTK